MLPLRSSAGAVFLGGVALAVVIATVATRGVSLTARTTQDPPSTSLACPDGLALVKTCSATRTGFSCDTAINNVGFALYLQCAPLPSINCSLQAGEPVIISRWPLCSVNQAATVCCPPITPLPVVTPPPSDPPPSPCKDNPTGKECGTACCKQNQQCRNGACASACPQDNDVACYNGNNTWPKCCGPGEKCKQPKLEPPNDPRAQAYCVHCGTDEVPCKTGCCPASSSSSSTPCTDGRPLCGENCCKDHQRCLQITSIYNEPVSYCYNECVTGQTICGDPKGAFLCCDKGESCREDTRGPPYCAPSGGGINGAAARTPELIRLDQEFPPVPPPDPSPPPAPLAPLEEDAWAPQVELPGFLQSFFSLFGGMPANNAPPEPPPPPLNEPSPPSFFFPFFSPYTEPQWGTETAEPEPNDQGWFDYGNEYDADQSDFFFTFPPPED